VVGVLDADGLLVLPKNILEKLLKKPGLAGVAAVLEVSGVVVKVELI